MFVCNSVSCASQGFAIGNGLTDPGIQYGAYADYALQMGIIGEHAHKAINKIVPACKLGIKLCGDNTISLISCELMVAKEARYAQHAQHVLSCD
jgi:hypothetical protein